MTAMKDVIDKADKGSHMAMQDVIDDISQADDHILGQTQHLQGRRVKRSETRLLCTESVLWNISVVSRVFLWIIEPSLGYGYVC